MYISAEQGSQNIEIREWSILALLFYCIRMTQFIFVYFITTCRDVGLARKIVNGVTKQRRALDVMLASVCSRPLESLSPEMLQVLILDSFYDQCSSVMKF